MSISVRHLLAAGVVATLGLAATACGDDGETITLYSGRGERLIQPIIDRFEDETGINVEVNYGDNAELALLIEEEAAAGRVEADLFLSQSPGSMGFIDDHLSTISSATLDLVEPTTRDADGRWVGISGRQRVLVYDSTQVDPDELPDSIFGLIDERWRGQVGVAGGNGSFQDFVTAMRFTEGEDVTAEFLQDLDGLDPVPYANNNAIVQAVGRGEVQVGLVNHYYNFRAMAEDPGVASRNHVFDVGDPGGTLIVTAVGILDGSDKVELAEEFLRFLLSEEGQNYFAEETFEYPLVPGIPTAGDVPPTEFDDIGSNDLNELDGGLERTRQIIADAGLES